MMTKEEFHIQLVKLLNRGTTDQNYSEFHYHADDLLRGWDAYAHPELAAQTKLVKRLPNGNLRLWPIDEVEMATIIIALQWSLQNSDDFEL